LGQITLAVQFGTADHFRIDYVNFIVANFKGTYHAILGRPALAKFMAIPHYIYLLLKMPTEKGILSLKGNVLIAYNYEKEGYATAKASSSRSAYSSPLSMPRRFLPPILRFPIKKPPVLL
jgi:hypothetical protein